MAHKRCNCYFSIWAVFYPFTSLTAWKTKIKNKNEKKVLEISSFYNGVPKIMIICYTVPEIRWVTDVIVIFHFWAIFCSFTPLTAQKTKFFKKLKKIPRDIIILHKCTTNYDQILYCSWDMVRDGRTDRWMKKVKYRGGCRT